MPRLSSLLQGSTALLRARLVYVRVTEYDRNLLIAARSLLKATSDLAPRALPQTVDQLKVSWVGDGGSGGCVDLGGTALHGSFPQPNVRWNISVNTSQWEWLALSWTPFCYKRVESVYSVSWHLSSTLRTLYCSSAVEWCTNCIPETIHS